MNWRGPALAMAVLFGVLVSLIAIGEFLTARWVIGSLGGVGATAVVLTRVWPRWDQWYRRNGLPLYGAIVAAMLLAAAWVVGALE